MTALDSDASIEIDRRAVVAAPPAAKPKAARFGTPALERGRLVLTATEMGSVGGCITALVNGIEIGKSAPSRALSRGGRIDIVCSYFPHVPLPAEVRFADEAGASEVAPALTIASAADVERLVGPGSIEEVRLAIRNGAIAGTGINRINGVGRPHLLGRINGHLLREVRFEAPRRRDQGGAQLSFTLAIEPTDLTESGATYELLALPELTIVASIAFPRSDAAAIAAVAARAEAAVANMSKRLELELARASELAERRFEQQREVLDGTVEYVVSLVYDTLAPDARPGPERKQKEQEALKAFRELMDSVAVGKTAADRLDYGVAAPASAYFADGWSWLEQDSKGFDFRWMGLGGVVLNPHPQRPVEEISVAIGVTYQHRVPVLSALLDDEPADVALVASPNGPPFSVKIVPRAGRKVRPMHVLRLTSATAGRPSEEEGSSDTRVLSIAVSGVTFYYGQTR